ncbi:invertebrate-type lysozyme 2-like isoform X2 [Hyposmocoma kahamanoa]|uniref:invertebrate-type lysozyme 2-like isoform X2 n=1 Tax=Hyposmocoma kahamanoa TaxID=1477025 RepID=UPI000E6D73EE|nr:invertebrate-type lysozyme 2-like isoform X2 [Hyposmocoma kahamanoa]
MASIVITFSAILMLVAASAVNVSKEANTNNYTLTEVCMGCLCQAVSGCKQGETCDGHACGLFHITQPYWNSAGKVTLIGQAPDQPDAQLMTTSNVTVTKECLACLCQAISGCKQGVRCEGVVCGVYRITKGFWDDADRPTLPGQSPEEDDAYSNCAIDPYCAAQAVEGYMQRYAQDCNNDGVVNCYDYIAIHKLGPFGCSAPLQKSYLKVFNNCEAAVAAAKQGLGTIK